jgi:excisionase family DNA binding protein
MATLEHDLTTDDVAAALRLNKATVQRLLKAGRLKGYQIGRSWRVSENALQEYRTISVKDRPAPSGRSHAPMSRDEWLRMLYDETFLMDGPPIPDEALRRENMYEDRD